MVPRRLPSLPHRTGAVLVVGALVGAGLGVVARAWMRLIADDPDFTWSGTLFIVLGFTVFGTTQAGAAVSRRRVDRPWMLSAGRVLGGIGMLPLFVAAGAPMLPTVLGGGLALVRVRWRPAVRAAALLVAAIPLVVVARDVVDSFGWTPRALAGVAGLVGLYTTIVLVARPTLAPRTDGWRLPRWALVAAPAGVLALVALPVGLRGIG